MIKDMVSVIIPVYNSSGYLEECLDSVLNQTYRNLQVILIDDGSEDDSWEICSRYSMTDDRILLLSQAHQGVSAARNMAMERSDGEFLFFLDSDDLIHEKLIELSYHLLADRSADVISVKYRKFTDESLSKLMAIWNGEFPVMKFSDDQTMQVLFMNLDGVDPSFCGIDGIGGKLIRRSVLGDLRFDTSIRLGEDSIFLFDLMAGGARLAISNAQLYYYRQHSSSSSVDWDIPVSSNYLASTRIIRDKYIAAGYQEMAFYLDRAMIFNLRKSYLTACKTKKKEAMAELRRFFNEEASEAYYRAKPLRKKIVDQIFFIFPWTFIIYAKMMKIKL